MDNSNFIYLALGTNLGNRRENLNNSIILLETFGVKFIESSPIYKTPALLLEGSPLDWNKPYLNCVIKVQSNLSPEDLLSVCKKIEAQLGRDFSMKWAPRPIDIDILIYKNIKIDTEILTIPHKAIFARYFLLDALSFLYPEYIKNINYYGKEHQATFMGILNITPDSFSDGGLHNDKNNFIESFNIWEEECVNFIDIGAESTNPNAESINSKQELERLEFVFEFLKNKNFKYLKPKLSIDTYHYETAEKALMAGFDIINDVNALKDERMLNLIKGTNKQYVLMHSLSVPPKKDLIIDNINDIKIWLENKLNLIEKKNISKNQIIFDFGFGFGKNPYQCLKLVELIEDFHKYGVKILIGHSRKSMLKVFENNIKTLDYETLAISLKLSNKIDIFRVHTPIEHQNAIIAYKTV